MVNVWDKIDNIGWKKEVEKCFQKNYPVRCPTNSFNLVERFVNGKTIKFCKLYSFCHRKHQRGFK